MRSCYVLVSLDTDECVMLFPHPSTVIMHLCNASGALLIGLLFAFIGLNAASGCGQGGGQCISVHDFTHAEAPPPPDQLAESLLPRDG